MKLKNILVTGGLGFIASHFSRLLVNSEYNVIIIDKRTYASDIMRIEDIRENVNLYIGDICDNKLVTKIIEDNNIDIIMNFAADTHVDNSINDSGPFIHSNFVGVHNLLDVVRKNDIDRFIQISTDEVYGSIEEGSFKETDRLAPGNPYSACKAGADLLTLSYSNTYGIDVCVTRSSNCYGPSQHREKFIPRMISLAIQGKDLEVYGNGNNVRDWLWVGDNCEGILAIMKDGISREIYNIGVGNEFTNNQIAKIIAERFGVGIIYIEERLGHDFKYNINCNKILNEIGWEAKMPFEEGIEKTIDWYIKEEKIKDIEATMGYD